MNRIAWTLVAAKIVAVLTFALGACSTASTPPLDGLVEPLATSATSPAPCPAYATVVVGDATPSCDLDGTQRLDVDGIDQERCDDQGGTYDAATRRCAGVDY